MSAVYAVKACVDCCLFVKYLVSLAKCVQEVHSSTSWLKPNKRAKQNTEIPMSLQQICILLNPIGNGMYTVRANECFYRSNKSLLL